MSMTDPDIKAKWFDLPTHRELAEIVGFDPSQAWQPNEIDGVELSDKELGLLGDLASGSVTAGQASGGQAAAGSDDVGQLLAKLGVASESEAIEYAIKTGVTWQ
jgi:hypothetical protein